MKEEEKMINEQEFQNALKEYKKVFLSERWPQEKFKWEAVKCFQDNWNLETEDFYRMVESSLKKTGILLTSRAHYPLGMILTYSNSAPDEVREAFRNLFNEDTDVFERVQTFRETIQEIHRKYGGDAKNHFHDLYTIYVYLWLKYPDKYAIYKFSEAKNLAQFLKTDYTFKKGDAKNNLASFTELYSEIEKRLKNDSEIVDMLKSVLTNDCDPDRNLCTLATDFGFYCSQKLAEAKKESKNKLEPLSEQNSSEKDPDQGELPVETKENEDPSLHEKQYWWLNTNPKIWSFDDVKAGETQSYTLYSESGHKRRIFQNFLDARPGDPVIGYASTPVKQICALAEITAEQDGKELLFRKNETLVTPVNLSEIKKIPELKNMEYLVNPQGSLFKLTKDEYEILIDIIRENNPVSNNEKEADAYSKEQFLEEVYMPEERFDRLAAILKRKKNIILQGAPGVGKTFTAKRLAYALMEKKDEERIEFVQFHQNYSYEDFVMGYKPDGEGFSLQYGIFYKFCQKAANDPDYDYFFIIDEINRGNLSKIFGELLLLIEEGYRGTKASLAYNGMSFTVPKNLYIIGMMNTADRSLAMIDYALRRRFSFFEMDPGFDSDGFIKYQQSLHNDEFNELVDKIKKLNEEIRKDRTLGKGFCIGHSYLCGLTEVDTAQLKDIVDYDILPMLEEYWFDDEAKYQRWANELHGIFQ
jgi:5-methylcytosine-specific restriction protein B